MTKHILFPEQETLTMIDGPVGTIEAMVQAPQQQVEVVGIICHPHPLQGGAMGNKVVTTVQRTLRELNIATLRFNFRGVGQSVGQFDNGIGETEDLLVVIQWAWQCYPQAKLCLAGFSFGSYVAYCAANQAKADLLISIAPPVTHFDMTTSLLPTMPWIIVQGDQDEVIDPGAVFAWIQQLSTQPQVITFNNVGHFFHGRLLELCERLSVAIQGYLR